MPLPSTYTPIFNLTISTSFNSITVSNIPQNYTDLVFMFNARGSNDIESDIGIRFNSDTSTAYSDTRMYGESLSAGSDRHTTINYINIGRQGGTVFAPNIYNIMNYTNANAFKNVVARSGHATSSGSITLANIGIWRSTSAITTIDLVQLGAQNYKSGCTFALYGIKAAS